MALFVVACVLLAIALAQGIALRKVKKECSHLRQVVCEQNNRAESVSAAVSAAIEASKEALRSFRDLADELRRIKNQVEKLEEGVIPNFEEAKEAVKAVNDFNTGLASIMNYDPMAAIKRNREEGDAE